MKRNETTELLKECNSGIRMGIDSIDEVLPSVKSDRLRTVLEECRTTHQRLGSETHRLLSEYGAEAEDPGVIAKGMSWLKTNIKMLAEPSDSTVADLITDGCNMGVKSLNGFVNKYGHASPDAVKLAKQVIRSEEKLCADMREFL